MRIPYPMFFPSSSTMQVGIFTKRYQSPLVCSYPLPSSILDRRQVQNRNAFLTSVLPCLGIMNIFYFIPLISKTKQHNHHGRLASYHLES